MTLKTYNSIYFFLWLYTLQLTCVFAQHNKNSFQLHNPINNELLLAGTFGELRSNHFHAGVDIKTNGREGLSVYAADNGFVSRIKISTGGYGKALYIEHPNGLTTVYAHLSRYSDKIEELIRKHQYKVKKYEVELFPKRDEIQIEQNEVIAYSGNTGGSSGPHLHFEIRKTAGQIPVNPLKYGIHVQDKTPPSVRSLYAYPVKSNSIINKSQVPIKIPIKRTDNSHFSTDSISVSNSFGLGLNSFDRQDLTYNKNGLHQIKVWHKERLIQHYLFESFTFSETKKINELIDYDRLINTRERVLKLFTSKEFTGSSIIQKQNNNGKIEIKNGEKGIIKIELIDFNENKTTIRIPYKGMTQEVSIPKPKIELTPYFVDHQKAFNWKKNDFEVRFKPNSFVKDTYLNLNLEEDVIEIDRESRYLKQRFKILKYGDEKDSLRGKKYFFRKAKNNREYPVMTREVNGAIVAESSILGVYGISVDTIKPTLRTVNFKKDQSIRNYKLLKLKTSDSQTGIKSYDAYFNGNWILMSYEPKTSTLTIDTDELSFIEPQQELKVIVEDFKNNKQELILNIKK